VALFGLACPSFAQCPDADWTLFPATGDAADVEVDGTIAWIASDGGLLRIDLSSVPPTQQRFSDSEGLVANDVSALAIDGFGNVWVGTRESGASVFDAEGEHLLDLAAFDQLLWSDKVVAMAAYGGTEFDGSSVVADRVLISSADTFSSSDGAPEGGGVRILEVRRQGGGFSVVPAPGTGIGFNLPTVTEIFIEPGALWFGTAGQGLFRRGDSGNPVLVLDPLQGQLLSGDVRTILRAPDASRGGEEVLWLATAQGLNRYDGTVSDTVSVFQGREILDIYAGAGKLYVIAEPTPFVQDLYEVDLAAPFDTVRVPRVACFPDTNYSPREVAVDATTGRVVLATADDASAVWDGSSWRCPAAVGPHWKTIADLVLTGDGTLWFGTGSKSAGAVGRGLGIFDGTSWEFLSEGLLDPGRNITELALWPDGSLWFASTRDRNVGGLQHYFPSSDSLVDYHDDLGPIDPNRTQGRNVWGLELDFASNLWVVYGQAGGGLSVIEWPTRRVTNYPFAEIFTRTTLLRDLAFDSRGRLWVSTLDVAGEEGTLYMIDTRGTIHDLGDDVTLELDMANEVFDLDEVRSLVIDSLDQIWLAGEGGLAVGKIGIGLVPEVEWRRIFGNATQTGGRNPSFLVAELDWNENVWLGTQQHGVVRITGDAEVWTWFDEQAGCPLPDNMVTSLFVDELTRTVYVGTSTGGIAKIDLGVNIAQGGKLDPQPFPNPFRPSVDGVLSFAGIPAEEFTTIRIFDLGGELVFEGRDLRGSDRVWDGRNVGRKPVEAGIYLVTATGSSGRVYEGKVAVVR
jgi:ligand-binding sensor domain-containing protein